MWGLLLTLLARLTPLAMVAGQTVVGYLSIPIYNSIKKHFKLWLIALLIVGNVVTGSLLYNGRNDLENEKKAHVADIQKVKVAQAEAEDKIEEIRTHLTEQAKIDATQADKRYANLYASYKLSLVRYKALQSVRSGPSDNQSSGPASSGNGPSGSTELPAQLTISGDDARICAVNTARLQALQAWANTLTGAK